MLAALNEGADNYYALLMQPAARITLPFFGLYGATKFALDALTESYRYELSQLGVDVTLVQPSSYPTSIFASAQRPADAARVTAYGEIGAIPDKMAQSFAESFAGENAPNPHEVAEAIVKLVNQPLGLGQLAKPRTAQAAA